MRSGRADSDESTEGFADFAPWEGYLHVFEQFLWVHSALVPCVKAVPVEKFIACIAKKCTGEGL